MRQRCFGIFRLGAVVIMGGLVSGCSFLGSSSKGSVQPAEKRILPTDIARHELSVPRTQLVSRLRERGTADGVRLIPILKGQSYETELLPEYRIFGVAPGGVYELLGLQNADVIVSADGYVIRDSRAFPEYVSLLKTQPHAMIEIRRDNKPLMLALTIKD